MEDPVSIIISRWINSLLITLTTHLSLVYTNHIQPDPKEYTLPENKTHNKDFSDGYSTSQDRDESESNDLICSPELSLIHMRLSKVRYYLITYPTHTEHIQEHLQKFSCVISSNN